METYVTAERTSMRLWAYLRVSTDRQAEHGQGLEVQENGIRAWARANGHTIAGWSRDEGISGSNGIEAREGLGDALAAVADARADGLVVYKLDRLARALTTQEGILAQAWQSGGRVFSVDGGEVHQNDPDDPMRTAMRQMGWSVRAA
jgi:DNA invertase Pin-like site-specific DNA recombinase